MQTTEDAQQNVETIDERDAEVVHGVSGSVVAAPTPKAKRIRPLAGIAVIILVVLAGFYMQRAMLERQQKHAATAEAPKAGQGPAEQMERAMLDDEAKHGVDTGQSHVASNLAPRTSLTRQWSAGENASAMPPLVYRESLTNGGQLSAEQQRKIHEYQLEQEALESATGIGGVAENQNYGQQQQTTTDSGPIEKALDQALANQADLKARIARIGSSGASTSDPVRALRAALGSNGADPAPMPVNTRQQQPQYDPQYDGQQSEYESQNGQVDKQQFSERASSQPPSTALPYARTQARGKYTIEEGWLIPAVLEQELNSDMPGMIRALVRENVYDSVTGKYLLIPAGSTLVGVYNSNIGYGQGAVEAVWRRILFPDGSSIDLGGFEGDDSQGASGMRDQVDNHWKRVLEGAFLTSGFAAGLQVSQGQNASLLAVPSYGQQLGSAVGSQVGELGSQVTRKNLNIQPTIKLRPGYRFFVRVERDILFQAPYSPSPTSEQH